VPRSLATPPAPVEAALWRVLVRNTSRARVTPAPAASTATAALA